MYTFKLNKLRFMKMLVGR